MKYTNYPYIALEVSMEPIKKNNSKAKILRILDNSPMGLTITEISAKSDLHRNTVSKYVEVLDAEGLIFKKEIHRAKVFFSKSMDHLPRSLMSSFIQALFWGMKDQLPDKEQDLKEIGRKILNQFRFPIGEAILGEFNRVKDIYDPQEQLKLFQEFYNSFDLFQDDLEISIIELNQKKIKFRLKNSEFLNHPKDTSYFFYLACGITEEVYLKLVNLKINCDVEKIFKSNNKEESYIDISLEIQSNH